MHSVEDASTYPLGIQVRWNRHLVVGLLYCDHKMWNGRSARVLNEQLMTLRVHP